MTQFNGLGLNLGNLARLSSAKTRSISPENPTGAKGMGACATTGTGAHAARELGFGWKISPSVVIKAGATHVLADIEGPGAIQQIWMTPTGHWRYSILRFYWDDAETPAVECPVGDFFACGWGEYAQVSSLPVCVNPGSAFTCYWEMPFRTRCRITMTNLSEDDMTLYYQVNYVLTEVPADAAYFHAQFRRVNPLPYKEEYVVLDGVRGQGHYVGTYLAWGSNNNLWWGEGEVKFFLDGDDVVLVGVFGDVLILRGKFLGQLLLLRGGGGLGLGSLFHGRVELLTLCHAPLELVQALDDRVEERPHDPGRAVRIGRSAEAG